VKQLIGGLALFILGVVVGTSGTDDTLLREAERRESAAYRRGQKAGEAKCHATATSLGYGGWAVDPHSGRADLFAWRRPDASLAPDLASDHIEGMAFKAEQSRQPLER
jgi:hypothetical protein